MRYCSLQTAKQREHVALPGVQAGPHMKAQEIGLFIVTTLKDLTIFLRNEIKVKPQDEYAAEIFSDVQQSLARSDAAHPANR